MFASIINSKFRTYQMQSFDVDRKAARSSLILFPLLGSTYLFFLWPNPFEVDEHNPLLYAYYFVNSILQSVQV